MTVSRQWTLRGTVDAPRSARQLVRSALADAGTPRDVCDTVELLTSELVTNVVRHAGTDLEVDVDVSEGTLHVGVRDGSSDLPKLRVSAASDSTGRGLALVDMLATRWSSIDHGRAGKTVWFEIDLG
jgi:anti-sigma regulatory factor (Ser/Thr protein kinase)